MRIYGTIKNYYVRMGDETIYHRNGKRDGSVHLFDIPSGNSLTISFIGGTKDNLKGIESSGILIGDKTSMYRRIIKDNLYAVLIGVLSLVLGVMCIVACLYMKAGKTRRSTVHCGIWESVF